MYLGLDLSLTATGIVLIGDDYKIILSKELSTSAKGVERLLFLENQLLAIIKDHPIELACIEGPAYHDTGRIFEIGEWNGIVKLHLFKIGIPFIIAVPLQVKKYVCGEGKAQGKELIILDVFKNFGVELRNNNIADAYVLARIAKDFSELMNGNDVEVKKYQLEVLEKIRKGQNDNGRKKII